MTQNKDALEALDEMKLRTVQNLWCLGIHGKEPVFNNLQKEYETICKALEAQQWQPIATAPKDGTYILLYRPVEDGRHKDAVREGKYHRYGMRYTWRVRSGCVWDIDAPTHWMPLPEAPAQEGGDA